MSKHVYYVDRTVEWRAYFAVFALSKGQSQISTTGFQCHGSEILVYYYYLMIYFVIIVNKNVQFIEGISITNNYKIIILCVHRVYSLVCVYNYMSEYYCISTIIL